MNDKKQNFIVKYFSEFGVLRECGKNFWLTNFIQFFDGLSYFTLIIVFSLFLNKYCGFRDADAPYWVGMYTLFVSLFVFAVGTICDIIGLRRTYLIGFALLIVVVWCWVWGLTSVPRFCSSARMIPAFS